MTQRIKDVGWTATDPVLEALQLKPFHLWVGDQYQPNTLRCIREGLLYSEK